MCRNLVASKFANHNYYDFIYLFFSISSTEARFIPRVPGSNTHYVAKRNSNILRSTILLIFYDFKLINNIN